jgi:hypothetical protein
MILQQKTLEKLRKLINEEAEYRSGSALVAFFNEFGFDDNYGQGFPSRWIYTDEKLSKINGTPELDKCIKKVFSPVNFIGRYSELSRLINEFNQYIAYDGWKVIQKGKDIGFEKADKINFEVEKKEIEENDFLKKEFSDISIEKLGLDSVITVTIKLRIEELKKCLSAKAPLAVIFLSGSTLEGILLGFAIKFPQEFNKSNSSPKKEGKVLEFHKWKLNNLIDVAYDVGLIKEDVKKFSHSLRDFRNYIHPFEQVSSRFNPDEHTAKICWQVLNAAIFQLCNVVI